MQRLIDIFSHARSISAHVKVRPILQPPPKLTTTFQHAILNIEFSSLVARKGEIQTSQVTGLLPTRNLLFVKKVGRASLITEEEPILSLTAGGFPLFEKRPKRSDARTRPNHNHGSRQVGRRFETMRWLNEH